MVAFPHCYLTSAVAGSSAVVELDFPGVPVNYFVAVSYLHLMIAVEGGGGGAAVAVVGVDGD